MLTRVPGVRPAFDRPFFKEFTLRLPGDVRKLFAALTDDGYLAGLPLALFYPDRDDLATLAVTEKRTKMEIDGLATALSDRIASRAYDRR